MHPACLHDYSIKLSVLPPVKVVYSQPIGHGAKLVRGRMFWDAMPF